MKRGTNRKQPIEYGVSIAQSHIDFSKRKDFSKIMQATVNNYKIYFSRLIHYIYAIKTLIRLRRNK